MLGDLDRSVLVDSKETLLVQIGQFGNQIEHKHDKIYQEECHLVFRVEAHN